MEVSIVRILSDQFAACYDDSTAQYIVHTANIEIERYVQWSLNNGKQEP